MGMSTKSRKAKGRKLQQWAARVIRAHLGLPESDVSSTIMGMSGADIQLSARARKLFPYSVECKNQEKVDVWASYEQAEYNTAKGTEPLLIIKKNYKTPLVVVDARTFIELCNVKDVNDGGHRD